MKHLIHNIEKQFAQSVISQMQDIDLKENQYQEKIILPYLEKTKNLYAISIFMENSTRTRTTFEMASGNMKYINFDISNSSINKNETIYDTFMTISSMNPNFIVMRSNDKIHFDICEQTNAGQHIINAGCGSISHPSQAISDLYLIKKYTKNIENPLVVICGDIKNSRVSQSNIKLLKLFGINVGVYTLDDVDNCHKFQNINEFIKDADIIMTMRAQKERHEISLNEYSQHFCLNKQIDEMTKNTCKYMHPGPVNRGIEIESDLIYSSKSLILEQVKMGLVAKQCIFNQFI